MSVHSVDHMRPPEVDDGYRGYDIDENGQVVEFYDHTNESSIVGKNSAISGSRRLLAEESRAPPSTRVVPTRREIRRSAGCCSCCVDCLITIGRLPLGSIVCFLLMWVGTGLFIGGGWAVMDETQKLFELYGPSMHNGNPALDPAPEYFLVGGVQSGIGSHYELRDPNNPGNRVPEVFLSIQRSFYGIIPFMLLFSLIVVADGSASTSEILYAKRGCKTSSAGICSSILIICTSYLLLLAWVFFLAFSTLGVYYYRMVMLRCEDLNNPIRVEGETRNICMDLVQIGLTMYRSTTDEYFGKLCGPGTTSRSVGDLQSYCQSYQHAWSLMLVCWSGAMLNIIAMMHTLIISSSNYRAIQVRYMKRKNHSRVPQSPTTTHRTTTTNLSSAPAVPYVVGTRDGASSNGDYRRRRSRDYELDRLDHDDDLPSSMVSHEPRRRFENNDSHAGVDYYYKRY